MSNLLSFNPIGKIKSELTKKEAVERLSFGQQYLAVIQNGDALYVFSEGNSEFLRQAIKCYCEAFPGARKIIQEAAK